VLKIRNKELRFGERTFVMGVVNVTPDSFSGDGVLDVKDAVNLALRHIEEGADLIDIGGQSTRPGHTPISEEEELARVLPVLKAIRQASDVIISIDTFSPLVFQQARAMGADIANSIWGFEKGLLDSVEATKCPVIIMHNKEVAEYPDGVLEEVCDYLQSEATLAIKAGLSREQIVLDPGIGFGKTADHNLEILGQLSRITQIGFPTLLGTSRKSTIGKLTGRLPEERTYGTAASIAMAIQSRIDIVRVHDVAEMIDVVHVADAVTRKWRPANWESERQEKKKYVGSH
jgi:dihydropteroate synthase